MASVPYLIQPTLPARDTEFSVIATNAVTDEVSTMSTVRGSYTTPLQQKPQLLTPPDIATATDASTATVAIPHSSYPMSSSEERHTAQHTYIFHNTGPRSSHPPSRPSSFLPPTITTLSFHPPPHHTPHHNGRTRGAAALIKARTGVGAPFVNFYGRWFIEILRKIFAKCITFFLFYRNGYILLITFDDNGKYFMPFLLTEMFSGLNVYLIYSGLFLYAT